MNKIREKLVELANDVLQYLPWGEIQKDTAERIADRMMDNGVTIANHHGTNGKLLIHFKPDKTLAELVQDLQNAPVMFTDNDGSFEIIKPYGWTSVKEGLPELIPCNAGTAYSEAVNVLTSGRKVLTAIWDGFDWICDASFWDAEDEEITHWAPVPLPLPLPDLPKEE